MVSHQWTLLILGGGGGGGAGGGGVQNETPFQTIPLPENIPENTLSLKENKWNLLFGLDRREKIKTICRNCSICNVLAPELIGGKM